MGRNNSKIPPDELNQLLNATYFNAKEVKRRYSGFLIDCPNGTLNREQFIDLYVSFYASTDAKKFAEHVFRTFDNNGDGKIDFHEFISSLSITTRGTIEEKLEWIFKLYDIDRNGFITLEELTSIVDSVKNMVGLIDDKRLSKENVQRIFDKLDKNSDGKLSLKEFIDGAREDESFVLMLQAYTPRNYFRKNDDEEELKLPESHKEPQTLNHPSEYLEYARSLLALSRSIPWKLDYELEKSYWFDTSEQNKQLNQPKSEKLSVNESPSYKYGDTFQELSKFETDDIEKAAISIVNVFKMVDGKKIEAAKSVSSCIIEDKPANKTYLEMVCEATPQEELTNVEENDEEDDVESVDVLICNNIERKLSQMLSEGREIVTKNIRQFLDNNQIMLDEVAVETGLDKQDIEAFVEFHGELDLTSKKEFYRWYLTKILKPPNGNADESYTCYKCGKIFTYKSYLERHIKYVCPDSTGRTWKCGYCGKAFQYPCYLRRHIRSHTGESPYKCDKCDRAFVRSTDLQRHIRNHTGEKPYRCTQCSRAFARSTDLKRHMRTHTGEKPYKCWQCRKSFSQSGSLQTHLQTHSKEINGKKIKKTNKVPQLPRRPPA